MGKAITRGGRRARGRSRMGGIREGTMSEQVRKEQPKSWPLFILRYISTPTGGTHLYYRFELPFLPFIGLRLPEADHEIKVLTWVQKDGRFLSTDPMTTDRPLEEVVEKHKKDGWQELIEVDEATGERGLP